MNMRDLLNQIDTLSEAGETAPNSIVPTHFHKSNIGTNNKLMMTEPGIFWWETISSQGERGGGGRSIERWQGNTESRSKWNPASVDGVYVDGKPVEFPEGVTWKTYKPEAVVPPPVAITRGNTAPEAPKTSETPPVVANPPDEVKQSTKLANTPASNSDHTAKLNALSLQLQDKLNAKKISNPAGSLEPTPGSSVAKPPPAEAPKVVDNPEADMGAGSGAPPVGANTAVAQNSVAANEPKASDELYTIQKGDNLTRLAKKFGTTVPELLKLNPDIKNPNLIIAGKDLKIPSGNTVQEGSMATALIESFGYDVELDEYSLNQFGTDVGAGARGIGNGLTFGYGDNLLARAKAGLGVEKDYKTALGKEMANTARAKANASNWKFDVTNPFTGNKTEFNPSVYDIGDTVGMVATPIPGSLAAKGGVKLAKAFNAGDKVAKGVGHATNLGANIGAAALADWHKTRHDKSATGLTQKHVDELVSEPEVLKMVQKKLGLPPTGKISPETLDAIDKAKIFNESKSVPLSESEKMAKLRNTLQRLDEGKTDVLGKLSGKEAAALAGKEQIAKFLGKPVDSLFGFAGKSRAELEALAKNPNLTALQRKEARQELEKLGTKPADNVVAKPADNVVAKPADNAVAKPADNAVAKPADNAVAKPADNAVADATTKTVKEVPPGKSFHDAEGTTWVKRNGFWEPVAGKLKGAKNQVGKNKNPSFYAKLEKEAGGGGGGGGGGGSASVKSSGNSSNTITNNPVNNITINIGGKELAAIERAVAHDAGAVVAKELAAVVKTGDKAAIGGWWARNKNKVKWTSGTLGVLSAVGLAGLLWGGKDGEQDMKPQTDDEVVPGPEVVPGGPESGGGSNVPDTGGNIGSTVPGNSSANTVTQDTKTDAEAEALIQQMQELMLGHQDDESPAWDQATRNAQSLIAQAKGSTNTGQIDADKEAARRMPASREVASTKPAANSEQSSEQDPERVGYTDEQIARMITLAGGHQRNNNTKDPTNVSKGTVIGK